MVHHSLRHVKIEGKAPLCKIEEPVYCTTKVKEVLSGPSSGRGVQAREEHIHSSGVD